MCSFLKTVNKVCLKIKAVPEFRMKDRSFQVPSVNYIKGNTFK